MVQNIINVLVNGCRTTLYQLSERSALRKTGILYGRIIDLCAELLNPCRILVSNIYTPGATSIVQARTLYTHPTRKSIQIYLMLEKWSVTILRIYY